MSKLLIIEDEYLERMELRRQLADLMPIDNIRTAGTVKTAIDAIKSEPPDLVLLDIMLMGSSGFEVASFIKKEYPTIKIVILTAYNEFDFAHMAMNLGISNYLLKPIKPAVLLETIKQSLTERNTESSQNKTLIWPYLENDSIDELKHKLLRYPNTVGAIYVPRQADKQNRTLDNLILDFGWTEIKGKWIFLFLVLASETDLKQFFDRLLENLAEQHSFELKIGVDTCFGGTVNISEAYHRAIAARKSALFFPGKRVLIAEECLSLRQQPGSYPFEEETALLMAINNGDRETCHRCIDEISKYMIRNCGKDVTTLTRWLQNLSFGITRFSEQKHVDYTANFDVSSANGFKDLREQIHQAALKVSNLLMQKKEEGNPLIHRALEIIRTRYNEDLNLTDVAQELFINHIYLSRLFKQQVGHSFKAYLIHVRMEAAAKLLSSCNITVAQVAQSVGYNDANYFSKSFHDYYGISPKEYSM